MVKTYYKKLKRCYSVTNYLIRHITDSTNHTFTEVIKPRENERYEIVSAESKEEALSYNEVSGDKNNLSVEEMRKRLRKGQ